MTCPGGDKCGTRAGYTRAGRAACQACRAAAAKYEAARQLELLRGGGPRIVNEAGTRRRIQALAAIGWPYRTIAAKLGTSEEVVQGWSYRKRRGVYRRTAASVAAVYADLCMTPGPSQQSRDRATAKGWPPPLAWDDIDDPHATPVDVPCERIDVDEVAVARAVAGDPPSRPLTRAERKAVVAELHARGCSDQQIAERAGLSGKTVMRIRQHLGLHAAQMEAAS